MAASTCFRILTAATAGLLLATAGQAGVGVPALAGKCRLKAELQREVPDRWSAEKANQWYAAQPWLVGCNFLPSTAVNDVEMWQAETFDPKTIDRELGWAHDLGFNTVRVFINYVVWKADAAALKRRLDQFLAIADRHGIKTMVILLDDCFKQDPKVGKQSDPVPGVHNSQWVASPGERMVTDARSWGGLEQYVKDMVGAFAHDRRIVVWDLYNEPTKSLPLVEAVFRWARQSGPDQPLTTCVYGGSCDPKRIAELSDVISFHCYGNIGDMKSSVTKLTPHKRPLLCTEWMARGMGSRFETHLPYLKVYKIGCWNWGLVAGRTQTYFPWGSPKGAPEPKLWHHDILRADGTPFDQQEVHAIRAATGVLPPAEKLCAVACWSSGFSRHFPAKAGTPTPVAFPGPLPGQPEAEVAGGRLRLSNRVLAAEWRVADNTLRFAEFANRLGGTTVAGVANELFAIGAPPLALKSADFAVEGPPRVEELQPAPKASRVAERFAGRALVARLKHAASGAVVEWRAELRENSHYVRQVLTLWGPAEAGTIRNLNLLNVKAAGAAIVGAVPGSPVVAGQTFLGVELPMSSAQITGDVVRWAMSGDIRWSAQHPCRFGSVIGVLPAGQTRRAFAAYLERERARESKPFLHYNCWYDLGEGVNERDMRKVVELFEQKLIRQRGIRLESFVLDDGWDDPTAGFWAVNKQKFPAGFGPLCRDLTRAGSHLGIWISPLAGYGGQAERIQRARDAGIVSPGAGLNLDLPAYYDWWLKRCSAFIRDEGVNYFKWDNAANFTSLARIAAELRKIDPNLFINTTVNTFPSPFFLNTMDATWRGGGDCGWFGPGSSRERYITYRDKELYARVVCKAPLYPINSIMHCAPVLGRHYQAAQISGEDMKNDSRALFGMGPVLQELYISPDLMTDLWWDQLAEAIRWAHANTDVLTDAHWIGGDPGKLEIYGCGAWSRRKGTVMLRNPSDKRAAVKLDIEEVFELPEGAARSYDLAAAYLDQRVRKIEATAGKPFTVDMEPFEVLVFDAEPKE